MLGRIITAFLRDDTTSMEVITESGETAVVGSGGGGVIRDYLGIERTAPQTLALVGDSTQHSVAFDTIFDQGDGSAISWDVGAPTDIVLAKGWYSVCATLFFANQVPDAATICWVAVIGQHMATIPMVSELGPAAQYPNQPSVTSQCAFVSMPSFLVPADGGILQVNGGAQAGASGDSSLIFAEVVVARLADAA